MGNNTDTTAQNDSGNSNVALAIKAAALVAVVGGSIVGWRRSRRQTETITEK